MIIFVVVVEEAFSIVKYENKMKCRWKEKKRLQVYMVKKTTKKYLF